MTDVEIDPPASLLPFWEQIVEGWVAWFANKESKANPYPPDDARHKAWRYGFFEAMDYGN